MVLFSISMLPYIDRQVGRWWRTCIFSTIEIIAKTTKSDFKNIIWHLAVLYQRALLKSQLSANHVCIQLSPAIITDGPPLSPVIHLQATLMAVFPACKSEDPICGKEETQTLSNQCSKKGKNNVFILPEISPYLVLSQGLLLNLVQDWSQWPELTGLF